MYYHSLLINDDDTNKLPKIHIKKTATREVKNNISSDSDDKTSEIRTINISSDSDDEPPKNSNSEKTEIIGMSSNSDNDLPKKPLVIPMTKRHLTDCRPKFQNRHNKRKMRIQATHPQIFPYHQTLKFIGNPWNPQKNNKSTLIYRVYTDPKKVGLRFSSIYPNNNNGKSPSTSKNQNSQKKPRHRTKSFHQSSRKTIKPLLNTNQNTQRSIQPNHIKAFDQHWHHHLSPIITMSINAKTQKTQPTGGTKYKNGLSAIITRFAWRLALQKNEHKSHHDQRTLKHRRHNERTGWKISIIQMINRLREDASILAREELTDDISS